MARQFDGDLSIWCVGVELNWARVAYQMNNGIVHFNVDYDDKRKLLICIWTMLYISTFVYSSFWTLISFTNIYISIFYISIVWKPSVQLKKGTMNKQLNRRKKV